MRGLKNGFKSKLRESVAPALNDIDSDSFQNIHNSCKMFASPLTSS